jgi:hypothetical protein
MRSKTSIYLGWLITVCLVLTVAACGGGSGNSGPDSGTTPGSGSSAGAGASTTSNTQVGIKVLSNRADLVSGGQVLIGLQLPPAVNPAALRIYTDSSSTNQNSAFSAGPNGQYMGLVTNLKNGSNTIYVAAPGVATSQVTVVNSPNGGPLFSGPQLNPWVCQPGALDSQCNMAPVYTWYYASTNTSLTGLQPYDPNHPPTDLAYTTTAQGVKVPFIVRLETGYQDRNQYQIATLYQPGVPWTAASPQSQFNHKLVITHGQSCGVSYQVSGAPGVLPGLEGAGSSTAGMLSPLGGTSLSTALQLLPTLGGSASTTPPAAASGTSSSNNGLMSGTDPYYYALSNGYAVMSTALDDSQVDCNVALQAESLVMAKEHVIENYGTLKYTIGIGCSGGSLAELAIQNAYPGIYQGLVTACEFPDAVSAAVQFADNQLLLTYYGKQNWGSPNGSTTAIKSGGAGWTPAGMEAVYGFNGVQPAITQLTGQLATAAGWFTPAKPAIPFTYTVADTNAFASNTFLYPVDIEAGQTACIGIAPADVYNATTNPAGVRCTILTLNGNLLGARSSGVWSAAEKSAGFGFIGLPVDNVGMQYGLAALQSGAITPAQFIDLNTNAGGINIDGVVVANREVADEPALTNVYRTGLVDEANNLGTTPIIDCLGPSTWLHDTSRSFALRTRLYNANQNYNNQVMYGGAVELLGDATCLLKALQGVETWLNNIDADNTSKTLAQKVVADKPASVVDSCFDSNSNLQPGMCSSSVIPVYQTPRMVAGDSAAQDTLKCQLKPLNQSDNYGPVPFTSAQWATMQQIFPSGVCDFTKPGVDKVNTIPWMTYQNADGSVITGGKPLPPVPQNSGGGWADPVFGVFAN